jgi:TetR/AcrR family transcriptional regulator, transcriptional repressor of bet genes
MPKRVDPDQRRTIIAEAAVRMIAAYGLDDVKLTHIARAAHCTTGAITHYFETKDDVLLAALEHVCDRLFAKMAAGSDASALMGLYEALPCSDAEAFSEWKVWLAFWGRATFVPRLAAVHRAYYRRIEDMLVADLGDDPDDARLTAAAIIAAIDGIGTRVCLEPDLWPADRQRALLVRLLGPLLATLTIGETHAPAHASAA